MKKKILAEIDRRINKARTYKECVLDREQTKATKLAADSYEEEKLTLQSIRKFINKIK